MQRCPKCPGTKKCIGPSGPVSSPLRFIGEAPGWEEEKKGQVFQGKTGQEMNRHYMPLAGLDRNNQWVGNAIGCMPITSKGKLSPTRTADLELLESCTQANLFPMLEADPYKLLIPMGSFANRAIDPRIDLEFQHGMPIQTKRGVVFPMYHPSLGIHEPKKMLHIRTDWIKLGRYLKGKLKIADDIYAGMEDYRALTSPDEVYNTLDGYRNMPLACDTENTQTHDPFCITYSVQPGTGYLIRAQDTELLNAFQDCLDIWRGKILWHNWLHDYEIVTAMGLKFPRKLIVDTMLKVFHLGNLPQGLKALSYRELGMTMQDFDDLVRPYSKQLILNYFRHALCEEWPRPEAELVKGKDGRYKVHKPHSFNQKLKRFFTDYEKDPDKDVFVMWDKNWIEMHETVQSRLWMFPGLCITHVPFERVISYACRDADALLRLYPLILKMERNVRRTVQENWNV